MANVSKKTECSQFIPLLWFILLHKLFFQYILSLLNLNLNSSFNIMYLISNVYIEKSKNLNISVLVSNYNQIFNQMDISGVQQYCKWIFQITG